MKVAFGFRFHRFPINQPQGTTSRRFAPEKDIGGNIEIIEQMKLLMDEGDAMTRRIAHGMNGH